MNGVFDLDFPQASINPDGAPGLKEFLSAYQTAYNGKPQSGHSLANYVGAKAFLDAMANANSTDAEQIRAAVLASKKAPATTANGRGCDFGDDGQHNSSIFIFMQW